MAIIDIKEKAKIRQSLAGDGEVDYNKADIDAATQVLEDWFDGDKLVVSALIDAATSPVVFTNSQKKKLAGYWMIKKSVRELL